MAGHRIFLPQGLEKGGISEMTDRTRKTAEERKTEIINAAIRLAGEIGPDRITTDRLAKEVGISQAGIFRHFPTKGEIWWAVAQRIGAMMGSKVEQIESDETNPTDKLQSLVIGHLSFIETTPAIPAILFSRELHAENEKMRTFFVGLMANRHHSLSKLIAVEISTGRFRKSLDPDDAAYLILTLIQGLAMRWSLNARDFVLSDEGKRLLDLQLTGFE